MTLAKLELALLTSFFIFVGNAQAQESTDYNDGIKQELKKEDMTVKATTLPAKKKKVVQKRIHKSTKQSKVAQAKKLKRRKLIAKADTPIKSDAVPVVVKDTTPVTAQESDEMNLENTAENDNVPALQEPKTIASNSNQVTPIYVLTPAQTSSTPAAAIPLGENPNNAPVAAVQPTTAVDSTVVPEPKSELLRQQREDLEHQTDSALLEKLETDRIAAEKARAEKIMAAANTAPLASPTPTPTVTAPIAPVASPTPTPAPVAVITAPPAPVVAPTAAAPLASPVSSPAVQVENNNQVPVERLTPSPEVSPVETSDSVGSSGVAAKAEGENTAQVEATPGNPEDEQHNFSVGATGGLANYPGVGNITPYYSAGVMGTYKFDDHFAIQANFDYSDFNITNASYCPFCSGGTLVKNMDQYNFATGVIYDIFKTRVTPLVGVLLDYTRRNYQDRITYGYSYGTPTGSNAFDTGLVIGADMHLTKNLILGAQFQYFWNLTYNTDNPLAYSYYGPIYGSPVEGLSYYIVGLNLRFAL